MAISRSCQADLDAILTNFTALSKDFNSGKDNVELLGMVGCLASDFISKNSNQMNLSSPGRKKYCAFKRAESISRPVAESLFLSDTRRMERIWRDIGAKRNLNSAIMNRAIYTSVAAFGCVFDLFKRSSRKTPGTYYEVCMGTLLTHFSGLRRRKQIGVPGERFKIPTDLVLEAPKPPSLVAALKITSRERVVQPWAHQRILNAIFGAGAYISIVVCSSEMQLSGKDACHEVLVPNQIGLFQKYLAKLEGMYYLDVPQGYIDAHHLPVKSVGELLRSDLRSLIGGK